MLTLDPAAIGNAATAGYLQAAIALRPICFASTVDAEGRPNLSPFSFFNIFSTQPATLIFSPSLSGRTGLPKDTLLNLRQVPEVCINVVTYDLVEQVSLSSTAYPRGINEFEKAGFTALPSEAIRPARVAESPVQCECLVREIISLGSEGGAGQLVLCEIVRLHLAEHILDGQQRIDPQKLDLVARMGGNWYTRAQPGMFEVAKPLTTLGIGVDALPEHVRRSTILTGNDLGRLGNVEQLPGEAARTALQLDPEALAAMAAGVEARHRYARQLLEEGKVEQALALLLEA